MKSLLFPRKIKCILCGAEISEREIELCDKCYSKLPFIPKHCCVKCGGMVSGDGDLCYNCFDHVPDFDKNISVCQLTDDVNALVYRLKYDGEKYLADTMGAMLFNILKNSKIEFDVVMPVPLNIVRENKRGYNQSDLLVQSMSKYGVNIDCTSLVRIKNTISQTHLSPKERFENTDKAFKVINKSRVNGKNIVIVDDVYTTGSTFNSIARELKANGAKNVYGLSFGHAI